MEWIGGSPVVVPTSYEVVIDIDADYREGGSGYLTFSAHVCRLLAVKRSDLDVHPDQLRASEHDPKKKNSTPFDTFKDLTRIKALRNMALLPSVFFFF